MKEFWKGVMEWKTGASLIFTGAMFFYLFFSWLFDNQTVSTTMLWTLLLVSIAASLIQGICFSNWIIKKMRYTRRSLLFVLLFLPTLAFAAWKAEWFPMEEAGAWAMFIGMFFLIFIVMTIGFDIYFRITGRKYDGMIGQYRREKEEKGE
ncbi:MAG: hypothetical protein HDT20_03720 [Oscillibacter sp.]|nr:hypothetical protein [Oscillibacter sp.]MBD5169216.1 hypothetical protein [Oscillibacter sp.]